MQLVELAGRTKDIPHNWWQSQSDAIPTWFNVFLSLENAATEFRRYDAEVVPGMFQTEDYSRAVISTRNPPTWTAPRSTGTLPSDERGKPG